MGNRLPKWLQPGTQELLGIDPRIAGARLGGYRRAANLSRDELGEIGRKGQRAMMASLDEIQRGKLLEHLRVIGQAGARALNASLTPEERSAAARRAGIAGAAARWGRR